MSGKFPAPRANLKRGLIMAAVAAAFAPQAAMAVSGTIPANTYFYEISLSGAGGGAGGQDTNSSGGVGSKGATITGVIAVNPGDAYEFEAGAAGGQGGNIAASGTAGASGTSPVAAGGRGGAGYSSGGGGGGGGASAFRLNGTTVLLAGGGGGGGGGASTVNGGDASTVAAPLSSCAPSAGANGTDHPRVLNPSLTSDGSGGGAGGGGAPGGTGGTSGEDGGPAATGGQQGTSCYDSTRVTMTSYVFNGGGAGGTNVLGGTPTAAQAGTVPGALPAALPSFLLQAQWPSNALVSDTITASTSGLSTPSSLTAVAAVPGGTTDGLRVRAAAGNVVTVPAPTITGSSYVTTLSCTSSGSPIMGLTDVPLPATLPALVATDTNVVCTYKMAKPVQPVPTLGEFGLLGLVAGMAGIGAARMRRRQGK